MGTNSDIQLKTYSTGLMLLLATAMVGFGQDPTPSPAPSLSTAPLPPPAPAVTAGAATSPVSAVSVPSSPASTPEISGTIPSSSQKPSKEPNGSKGKPAFDSIYSALVLATNAEGTPSSAPTSTPELAPLVPRLKSIFGYNHFELVGAHTELMDNPDEHWLVPSKAFSLSIKSKREKNSSYLLNLQLFQETKMLASFDAKLRRECPILIRGPLCGKGQLVIVVIVR